MKCISFVIAALHRTAHKNQPDAPNSLTFQQNECNETKLSEKDSTSPLTDETTTYDAYVLYNDENDELNTWIFDHLIVSLEKVHKIKLYLTSRDQNLGVYKIEEYVNAMQNSQKILILLTNDLSQKNMLNHHLHFVHEKHEMGYSHVLICQFEDIDETEFNGKFSSLHKLMKDHHCFDMREYDTWPSTKRDWIWQNIANKIKRKK